MPVGAKQFTPPKVRTANVAASAAAIARPGAYRRIAIALPPIRRE
jgi:hypothetical protein